MRRGAVLPLLASIFLFSLSAGEPSYLDAFERGMIVPDIAAGASGITDLVAILYEGAAARREANLKSYIAGTHDETEKAALHEDLVRMRIKHRNWARLAGIVHAGSASAYELTSDHNDRLHNAEKALASTAHIVGSAARANALTGRNLRSRLALSIFRTAALLARNRLERKSENASLITGLGALQRLAHLGQLHLATTHGTNRKTRSLGLSAQAASLLPLLAPAVTADKVAWRTFNKDGSLNQGQIQPLDMKKFDSVEIGRAHV